MGEVFLSLLILFAIIGFSLLGMFLVRRSVPVSTLESHHEVAGFIYAVVGVIYAVILAFAVLVVWEQYNSAEEKFELEATSVSSVFRHSQGIDDIDFKTKARGVAREYAKTMILNELPAMSDNRVSIENMIAYNKFWKLLTGYQPKNEHDKFWYESTVESLGELQVSRRLRMLSIFFGVPGYIWFVLITGGFLTIAFSFLFGTKKAISHAVMVICLSGIIGLALILIGSLEHPYSGIIKVEPKAFIELMKLF